MGDLGLKKLPGWTLPPRTPEGTPSRVPSMRMLERSLVAGSPSSYAVPPDQVQSFQNQYSLPVERGGTSHSRGGGVPSP